MKGDKYSLTTSKYQNSDKLLLTKNYDKQNKAIQQHDSNMVKNYMSYRFCNTEYSKCIFNHVKCMLK